MVSGQQMVAELSIPDYLKLVDVYNGWFTGSIGYHHVHHLNPRIPNYNLAKCHDTFPELKSIKPVELLTSLKALSYRLLDEKTGKMIGFREAKKIQLSRTERVRESVV